MGTGIIKIIFGANHNDLISEMTDNFSLGTAFDTSRRVWPMDPLRGKEERATVTSYSPS